MNIEGCWVYKVTAISVRWLSFSVISIISGMAKKIEILSSKSHLATLVQTTIFRLMLKFMLQLDTLERIALD